MLKVICEKITNSLYLLLFCILKVHTAVFFVLNLNISSKFLFNEGLAYGKPSEGIWRIFNLIGNYKF